MFKVVQNPTFLHDVTVMTPIDGGHATEMVKVRYRLLDVAVVDAFDFNKGADTSKFLDQAVVSFADLIDDNDQPIACTDALRDALLKKPHIRLAVIAGYMDAVTKAKAGN